MVNNSNACVYFRRGLCLTYKQGLVDMKLKIMITTAVLALSGAGYTYAEVNTQPTATDPIEVAPEPTTPEPTASSPETSVVAEPVAPSPVTEPVRQPTATTQPVAEESSSPPLAQVEEPTPDPTPVSPTNPLSVEVK